MFQSKRIFINLLMLIMIIFLTAYPAFAQSTSLTAGIVEMKLVNKEPASNSLDVNEIHGYSRWWFMPACTYGQQGYITFDVDTGPFTVDFVSSKYTYHNSGACTADICGYMTWAPAYGLIELGEYMNFATVNGNNPIITSGWCGSIASPGR